MTESELREEQRAAEYRERRKAQCEYDRTRAARLAGSPEAAKRSAEGWAPILGWLRERGDCYGTQEDD